MSKIKIFVAGHKGMVGSAIIRCLLKKNKKFDIITKNRNKLDLTNQQSVKNFFKKEKIDQIYLTAAKVGGILANSTYPASFIYENLMIEANIINSAFESGVKRLLFFGSSCIYPKFSNQPIKENDLLTGSLEPTNEPYSIAKIAGIKLCESYNRQYGKKYGIDYRSIMPTNLYGPGDNYDLKDCHVIPALIRKFHEAKTKKLPKVLVWGSGNQKREFLHVDDLADASFKIMNLEKKIYYKNIDLMCSHINVGFGSDLSIKALANLVKKITQYKGKIEFDTSKPDGMKKKLLNNKKILSYGWKPKYSLEEGLKRTYRDFLTKKI
jgi:GDP-L-fucose synthase